MRKPSLSYSDPGSSEVYTLLALAVIRLHQRRADVKSSQTSEYLSESLLDCAGDQSAHAAVVRQRRREGGQGEGAIEGWRKGSDESRAKHREAKRDKAQGGVRDSAKCTGEDSDEWFIGEDESFSHGERSAARQREAPRETSTGRHPDASDKVESIRTCGNQNVSRA